MNSESFGTFWLSLKWFLGDYFNISIAIGVSLILAIIILKMYDNHY